MKPYMIFSRGCGPEEGAALVFAHSAKEARKLAWKQSGLDFDDFIDMGIRLIHDTRYIFPLANQDKLKAGTPHIVDNPAACKACGYWGAGLTKDGLCGNCNEYPGDKLVNLFGLAIRDET